MTRRFAMVMVMAMAFSGVTTACLDDSITGTRPLSFSVTADVTTPVVGQDVTFSFEAGGTGLRSVAIDFGDGVTDTTSYFGPVAATGQVLHAYTSTGIFLVRGTAVANAGVASDEITVTVN